MEIKLSEKDVKYFQMLNSSIAECEQKIAALEIEKIRVAQTYFAIEEKYREFSKQIRAKYEVQHPDAEIDLVKGIIVYPEDIDDAGSSGTEVNEEPIKPVGPPVRIVQEGEDPEPIKKKRVKKEEKKDAE